jgi:hypothetical protein
MTEKSDLPLPDYDHLPLGTLETRLHALDEPGVTALLDHERAHGDRLPVVQLLESRLTRLRDGARPSGGLPVDEPSVGAAPAGGSPVDPSTSGPAMNPPSQGDPTNSAQPR